MGNSCGGNVLRTGGNEGGGEMFPRSRSMTSGKARKKKRKKERKGARKGAGRGITAIYIYMCTGVEFNTGNRCFFREASRCFSAFRFPGFPFPVCRYIHIHIYTHINTYIYIYI